MKLKIGSFEIEAIRVADTVYNNSPGDIQNKETIEITIGTYPGSAGDLSKAIAAVFSGDFTVSGDKELSFSGYTLDTVRQNLGDGNSNLSVQFISVGEVA